MSRCWAVFFLLWIIGAAAIGMAQTTSPNRPNIIVIMADDLGYGDVSCFGAQTFSTPNIDRLAAHGRRFTSGYCSASTCTPTRYSFLTGTYAFRKPGTGVAPPNSPALIQPGTPTIASQLKQAGYRTGVVGKWHLGLGDQRGPDWNGVISPGPLEIGFDYCYLLPTTNDRVPQVYVENHRVANLDPADPLWVGMQSPSPEHPDGKNQRESLKLDWDVGHNGTIHNGISRIGYYTGGVKARFRDEDLADDWVKKSLEFIEQSTGQPFFLFYASHDIHVPRTPHERFQNKTPHGSRGDAIIELDWTVGAIMKSLEEKKLLQDTLIIFCSDNGPVLNDGYRDESVEKLGKHQPSGPLRGGKYSVYEGGTRIPFIVHWPSRVPAGDSEQVVCTIDVATSLSKLVGQSVPSDGFFDSLDLHGALFGEGQGRSSLIEQDNGGLNGNLGFRKGSWKLLRKKPAQDSPVQIRELYDLSVDLAESRDVARDFPDVVKSLDGELQSLIDRGKSRE